MEANLPEINALLLEQIEKRIELLDEFDRVELRKFEQLNALKSHILKALDEQISEIKPEKTEEEKVD